ncbi:unnamed protein product, partial [Hapterophycus canaliculatus]
AGLGLATSFVFVVGMAEGARVSAVKGDLKFPIRYAMYNAIPSFVGGKVPASSVASAMANAPPLRTCPRAAAHAANLRALRTAVAGYTVLSVVFQVALAGGRGTEAHQQAVAEGLEMPSLSAASSGAGSGSAGGVVRLCGARGLEPALVAAAAGRGGYRAPVLPVVISGGAFSRERGIVHHSSRGLSNLAAFSLPEGARAAVAKCSPRPCYYRIDRDRLFCREAWKPVASEVAAVGASLNDDRGMVLVIEADALSSDDPQGLMSPPAKSAATGARSGGGVGLGGRLGEDQALWGLSMLRRAIEEKRERENSGRVASVLLAERRMAEVEGSTTVSIDARAALLLSVLSWAQQWAVEGGANDAVSLSSRSSEGSLSRPVDDETETLVHEVAAPKLPENDAAAGSATAMTTAQAEDTAAVFDAEDDAAAPSGEEARGTGEEEEEVLEVRDVTTPPDDEDQTVRPSTTARVLGTLEGVGRGVRVAVAPVGRVWSAAGRSLSVAYAWAEERRRRVSPPEDAGVCRRTLLYDTDDDESFRWLAAQMLRTGWTVVRTTSQLGRGCGYLPVLVHRFSDESTLTAAARHVAGDADVCAVVHNWDCAAEARHLLRGAPRSTSGQEPEAQGPRSSAEVICTAEVGEDLFQFVRWQLLSGATTEQVQKGLDELFGAFYEADEEDLWRWT